MSLVLKQAAVLAVGTPAVKLLGGHGEHTDAAGDADTALNKMSGEVFMPCRVGAQRHGQSNAVHECPEADNGAEHEGDYTKQGFHKGHWSEAFCCPNEGPPSPGVSHAGKVLLSMLPWAEQP